MCAAMLNREEIEMESVDVSAGDVTDLALHHSTIHKLMEFKGAVFLFRRGGGLCVWVGGAGVLVYVFLYMCVCVCVYVSVSVSVLLQGRVFLILLPLSLSLSPLPPPPSVH